MALTDKERTKLIEKAATAMKAAKKKSVVEIWTNEEFGFQVLGHKVLARLLLGKTAEEAGARRGKKED